MDQGHYPYVDQIWKNDDEFFVPGFFFCDEEVFLQEIQKILENVTPSNKE